MFVLLRRVSALKTENIDNEEFKILDAVYSGAMEGYKGSVFLTAFVPMSGRIEKDVAIVFIGSGEAVRITPDIKEGYGASFYCGKFLTNGLEQVLYSIFLKNQKEYAFYLYSPKNGMLQPVFDASGVKNNYSVDYKDYFKAVVTNNDTKEKHLIDLIYKKDLLKGLYDINGILLQPAAGSVGRISGVIPFDTGNGRCGIIIYMRIAGANGDDTLGYMALKYIHNGGEFMITDAGITGRLY